MLDIKVEILAGVQYFIFTNRGVDYSVARNGVNFEVVSSRLSLKGSVTAKIMSEAAMLKRAKLFVEVLAFIEATEAQAVKAAESLIEEMNAPGVEDLEQNKTQKLELDIRPEEQLTPHTIITDELVDGIRYYTFDSRGTRYKLSHTIDWFMVNVTRNINQYKMILTRSELLDYGTLFVDVLAYIDLIESDNVVFSNNDHNVNLELIPNDIGCHMVATTRGYDLQCALNNRFDHNEWLRRVVDELYLVEDEDYTIVAKRSCIGHAYEDYYFNIEAAKSIAISSRTARGKVIRDYYIALEIAERKRIHSFSVDGVSSSPTFNEAMRNYIR